MSSSKSSRCATGSICARLETARPALAASDLLLLKAQIVELNPKDETDILALLLSHQVSEPDTPDALSTAYIGRVCADDWAWFTTVQDDLDRVERRTEELLTSIADKELAVARIAELREAVGAAPKSLRWRVRDRVGRRRPWYELPEEVGS